MSLQSYLTSNFTFGSQFDEDTYDLAIKLNESYWLAAYAKETADLEIYLGEAENIKIGNTVYDTPNVSTTSIITGVDSSGRLTIDIEALVGGTIATDVILLYVFDDSGTFNVGYYSQSAGDFTSGDSKTYPAVNGIHIAEITLTASMTAITDSLISDKRRIGSTATSSDQMYYRLLDYDNSSGTNQINGVFMLTPTADGEFNASFSVNTGSSAGNFILRDDLSVKDRFNLFHEGSAGTDGDKERLKYSTTVIAGINGTDVEIYDNPITQQKVISGITNLQDLQVSGDYVYVLSRPSATESDIHKVDVDGVVQNSIRLNHTSGREYQKLAIFGGYVYAICADDETKIARLDLSDMSYDSAKQWTPTDDFNGGARCVQVLNSKIYCSYANEIMEIDWANDAVKHSTLGLTGNSGQALATDGTYIYAEVHSNTAGPNSFFYITQFLPGVGSVKRAQISGLNINATTASYTFPLMASGSEKIACLHTSGIIVVNKHQFSAGTFSSEPSGLTVTITEPSVTVNSDSMSSLSVTTGTAATLSAATTGTTPTANTSFDYITSSKFKVEL